MIRLQPKTLERLRNHLREVGQPASVALTRPKQADDPFSGDADAALRFAALFEVMHRMVSADGVVADAEREVLRGAARGLTDGAVRSEYLANLSETCRETANEGRAARLAALAPTLKDDDALVDAAFSLAAAIAFADDEIQDEENELINELAEALGIDDERAEALLAQLEADSED